MKTIEDIIDELDYLGWEIDVYQCIRSLLTEDSYVENGFVTKNNITGYSLRIAYDEHLDVDDIVTQLRAFGFINDEKLFSKFTKETCEVI